MSRLSLASQQLIQVLTRRGFQEPQISSLIPRLHPELAAQPKLLGQVIDAWNYEMTSLVPKSPINRINYIPAVASAPKRLDLGFTLNTIQIFVDKESDLLNIKPEMISKRKEKILSLGLIHSEAELWKLLYFAPRGFFLQEWKELSKKFHYIEHNVLNWLYDKNERKALDCHPMISNARVSEQSFDHIRTRFLFAQRSGYKTLVNCRKVQTLRDMIGLRELILDDTDDYLKNIAPSITLEEYSTFEKLIKSNEDKDDCDDAKIYDDLAELEDMKYQANDKYLSNNSYTIEDMDQADLYEQSARHPDSYRDL